MKTSLVWKSALLSGVAIFVASLLVACGGGGPTPPKPTTPAPKPTTPAPTTPAPTTPAPTPAGGPPAIPASHVTGGQLRAGCSACHAQGLAGAPKYPASPDHASFTDATCSGCHKAP